MRLQFLPEELTSAEAYGTWFERNATNLLAAGGQLVFNLTPHTIDRCPTVDCFNYTFWFITGEDRDGLAFVAVQSLLQSISSIIPSLHQWFTSQVVLHGCRNNFAINSKLHRLWWGVLHVVRSARSLVDPAATYALLENIRIDVESHNQRYRFTRFGEHFVESFRLRKSAGKSIQDESRFAVYFLDAILDDSNHYVITDQTTCGHYSLCLSSDFGTCS